MVNTRKNNGSYKTAKKKEYITKQNNLSDIKLKISDMLSGSRWVIKDGWVDGRKHNISYEDCKKIANDNNIRSASEWFIF